MCWGAAKRGYCTMLDALLSNFKLNDTDVSYARDLRVFLSFRPDPRSCTALVQNTAFQDMQGLVL